MLQKQQLLQGQPYTDVQFKNAKWLKFDGINDFVQIGDSSFYNLSGKNFTICIRAFVCRLGSGSSSRLIPFIQKGSGADNNNFYWVGTLGGSYQQLGFRFGNAANTTNIFKGFGVSLTTFNIETSVGLFTPINLAFIRLNQDGSNSKLIDPANYKVWINGVRRDTYEVFSSGTITSDPFNNDKIVTINGTTGTIDISRMYMASYNFYDRALSDTEITDLFNGNISVTNNKGSFNFNSQYGNIVRDNSSVGNNGSLINYATTTDAANNSVWIDDLIGFLNNETKIYTALKNQTVTKIGRGFHSSPSCTSFTIVHKRAGATQATYTYNWGGSITTNLIDSTYQIVMLQGDTLEITTSGMTVGASGVGHTRYGCVCEIFTH